MKKIKILATIILAAAFVLCFTACGGSGEKKYKWGDAEFIVKSVTDDKSVTGDHSASGKCVAVVIDFGDKQMGQKTFEGNVNKGMLQLAGQKPVDYKYHMANMTFGGTGFETMITGETVLYFDMDASYTVNADDLVITE